MNGKVNFAKRYSKLDRDQYTTVRKWGNHFEEAKN